MLRCNKYFEAAHSVLTGRYEADILISLHCNRGPASGRGLRGRREGTMTIEGLIIWLIIGAIAGWLAGMVMKGGGFGLVGDIIVGIIGAFIAGWLLPRLGILIGGSIIGEIINAFIGAVIL